MKPYSAIFLFVCALAVSTWADAPDSGKSDSLDGATREELVAMRRDIKPSALRALLEDLRTSSGSPFPKAAAYSARLDDIEKEIFRADELLAGSPSPTDLEQAGKILRAADAFQRELAMAIPALNRQPLLFVLRSQYLPDHHNTETVFHTGEPNVSSYRPSGPLKLLDPATGRTSTILDPGPTGSLRDPEVHFDGRKLLVAMRKSIKENYSIYELELDPQNGFAPVPGSLRRLTGEPEASDINPLYLPDGKIIFTSTREPKYCHCNMHIMANLHRMDGDGANIHQISKNTLFDGHPRLLPDGRILYDRWEYVDRNFGDAQGLWTVNPDGTNHAIYWKNNMVSPASAFDGRFIPGTDRMVCIFGSCHDRPWGALAIVDRSKGIDSKEAVERIWPDKARALLSEDGSEIRAKCSVDHFSHNMKERYENPFPLVDPVTGQGGKYFVVSRSLRPYEKNLPELRMGIFLVDIFGNEILLYYEDPGCFEPTPVAAHPCPRVIPDRRDFTSPTGTMYVTDAYEGTHMQGVRRGDIKWLRVVESTEKRAWTVPLWFTAQSPGADGTYNRPAISWAGFETKRILGTVPVEVDGSAYFELPAEKFVYFQLLDGDGMMVASMRSGTLVQPGETRGFELFQNWGKPEALLNTVGLGLAPVNSAYAVGSHQSRLVKLLKAGHHEVKLNPEEMQKIITWIDIGGPYYPNYYSANPDNVAGRSALPLKQLKRLEELTGTKMQASDYPTFGQHRFLISFDRPELSPILEKLAPGGEAYNEVVSIIRAGQDEMKKNPEADQPGFTACADHKAREEKYLRLAEKERVRREALAAGRKVYDPGIGPQSKQ